MIAEKTLKAELKDFEEKQLQISELFNIKQMDKKSFIEKERDKEIEIFQKKHKITFNDMKSRHNSEKKEIGKNKDYISGISQAFTSKHTTGGKSLIK